MKVITFSRHFPQGHPKAGQPTFFVEKITSLLSVISPGWSMASQFDTLRRGPLLFNAGEYRRYEDNEIFKSHTIRNGSRWRQGEWASLRVWSDKPYTSKQIEFAKVCIAKVWKFEIKMVDNEALHVFIDDVRVAAFHPLDIKLAEISDNDGLEVLDFLSWFSIHPKKKEQGFCGQILSWNKNIVY